LAETGLHLRGQEPRPRVLFLCHRLPFPPNKGDKIRSYHWLRALCDRFRVSLGAFVDAADDWAHEDYLSGLCEDVCLVALKRTRATIRSLAGLFCGEPLTKRYYLDAEMSSWVRAWSKREDGGTVFVYSSAMAQYVTGGEFRVRRRVIDFVDVDAEKWRQYADHRRGAGKWVYRREAKTLAKYDAEVARTFDFSLFVSEAEARLFSMCAPAARRVGALGNGVDSDFFTPDVKLASPFDPNVAPVVFTGAMDYWPNVDAASWFVTSVWPDVLRQVPTSVLYLVGANPATGVVQLQSESVVVTGTVPDVRPYLRFARVVVAPMRVARGVQNKVLEGMAMAQPIVVTSAGLEGLSARDGEHLLVADEPDGFARRVVAALEGKHSELGHAAREWVRREYDWTSRREQLIELLYPHCNGARAEA